MGGASGMGRTPGIDIDAYRKEERWIIEVKGIGLKTRNARELPYQHAG